MTGDRLRELAQAATPGPWRNTGASKNGHVVEWNPEDGGYNIVARCFEADREADARLIALAPDMAVLLADAIDALAYVDNWRDRVGIQSPEALLARFRQLGDTA